MPYSSDPYPQARLDRPGLSLLTKPPQPSDVTVPRTFFFSFALDLAANSRTSRSSRQLQGPVIIKEMAVYHSGLAQAPPGDAVELGWADAPVTESSVAVTAAKSWNQIFEQVAWGSSATSQSLRGLMWSTVVSGQRARVHQIDQLVIQPQFYLIVSCTHAYLGAQADVVGYVTGVEGVSQDAVRFFR